MPPGALRKDVTASQGQSTPQNTQCAQATTHSLHPGIGSIPNRCHSSTACPHELQAVAADSMPILAEELEGPGGHWGHVQGTGDLQGRLAEAVAH